ncbi:MAG: MarC family protein [Dehalococcoidales bacterium]|nr:MarC family protein [Dehalococcoidales bacterium]
MSHWLGSFALVFIPLFIAIDAVGNLPFVMSLSEGMSQREQRRMLNLATTTAGLVGIAFLFLGELILRAMGISVGSFAIAGGIILLALSIRHMITGHFVDAIKEEIVAVVPIGTPLTVGPATITTLMLLNTEFPTYMVLIAFALNILAVWVSFMAGGRIAGFLGQGGMKALSKVFSLLLAAIAVSMIIRGLHLTGMVKP